MGIKKAMENTIHDKSRTLSLYAVCIQQQDVPEEVRKELLDLLQRLQRLSKLRGFRLGRELSSLLRAIDGFAEKHIDPFLASLTV